MYHRLAISGRCKWCGTHLDDTTGSTECLKCANDMIFISQSWTYGPNGELIEDSGWYGPRWLMPRHKRQLYEKQG